MGCLGLTVRDPNEIIAGALERAFAAAAPVVIDVKTDVAKASLRERGRRIDPSIVNQLRERDISAVLPYLADGLIH